MKRVPYLFGISPRKLAYRLTKDYDSEYQKVLAIHNWITHNIKYDIKKADRFDFSHYPIKKVLRRRKATCVGYSDLFNELCKHSGILSAGIQGYSKNLKVDVSDKFYLDDHMWNAVYIDKNWHLVDACWDAGYVKSYNRGFLGHIIFGLTLGKVRLVRYNPRFIFRPGLSYFCKGGREFQYDHVPIIPIWQLTNPILPIDSFERDSSFYYRNQISRAEDENRKDLNAERVRIAKMESIELALYQGPVAYDYNSKNFLTIAISKNIEGVNEAKLISLESKDTLDILKRCDTSLALLFQARMKYDSALIYLGLQKTELLIKNQLKNKTFSEEINRLSNSRNNNKTKINSEKKFCELASDKIEIIRKRNYEYLIKLGSLSIKDASKLANNDEQDSLDTINNWDILYDSITAINSSIGYNFNKLDSLNVIYKTRFSDFIRFNEKKREDCEKIIDHRLIYLDDLDFEIRLMRDSTLPLLSYFDSSLYDSNGIILTRSFVNEFKLQENLFRKLYEVHRTIARKIALQHKTAKNKDDCMEHYYNNIDQFRSSLSSYDRSMSRTKELVLEFYYLCRTIELICEEEKKLLNKERKIEKQMSVIRRNYITRYYSAHVSLISKERLALVSLINQIQNKQKSYRK